MAQSARASVSVLYILIGLTAFVLSAWQPLADQSMFGLAAIVTGWICFLIYRFLLAYFLERQSASFAKHERSPTLPGLLHKAYSYDVLAKECVPRLTNIPSSMFWTALFFMAGISGSLYFVALGAYEGVVAFVVLFIVALAGGAIYSQLNHPVRLQAITRLCGLIMTVCFAGGFIVPQPAAAGETGQNYFSAPGMLVAICMAVLFPVLMSLLRLWGRKKDPLAMAGIALFTTGSAGAFVMVMYSSVTGLLLAFLFTLFTCLLSIWLRLHHKWQPYYYIFSV